MNSPEAGLGVDRPGVAEQDRARRGKADAEVDMDAVQSLPSEVLLLWVGQLSDQIREAEAAQEKRRDVAAELMRRRVGAKRIAEACGLSVHAVRRWLFLRSKADE